MLRDPIQRCADLSDLVGNTPLLALDLEYKGEPRRLYAKAENLNWTGSIKDLIDILGARIRLLSREDLGYSDALRTVWRSSALARRGI